MIEAYLIQFIIFVSFLLVLFFIRSKNRLDVIIFSGSFSLLTAVMYLLLDAPDVAMTEAAVGVLITIFSIYALKAMNSADEELKDKFNPILFILALGLASLLIYAAADLPEFGNKYAISQQTLATYYIENTHKEIGVDSVVAAILASYRGFDTLLETLVILVGGLSVLLISPFIASEAKQSIHEPASDLLTSKLVRFVLPLIILFGLYLQIHGEISPGGGFQAGAIIATGFILYDMVIGKRQMSKRQSLAKIAILGWSVYFITGIISLLLGAEFLNYNIIGQKLGIMTVELGVGIAVSATLLLIYFCLSEDINDQSKL
jgi:multicomponent Na+:H+ antiporter subunit B